MAMKKTRMISAFPALLVAVGLALAAGGAVSAAEKRLVSTTGSDLLNNCIDSPCATISHAIVKTVSGDTVSIAPGTYNESLLIPGMDNLTLQGSDPFSRPKVTGGIQLTGINNHLHLRDLILAGDAALGADAVIDNSGFVLTGLAMHRVQIDGENVATRQGITGGQFGGAISITRCEFLNIKGGIVFDTRELALPAEGASLTSVVFSQNLIRNTQGHIRFQHQSGSLPDVIITNNSSDTAGNALNGYGGLFKVVRAANLWFLENNLQDIGTTGLLIDAVNYGAALIPREITLLTAANNTFKNNRQGIALDATAAFPAASITGNSFQNNVYGIFLPTTTAAVGPHTLTRNNFTGNSAEAIHNGSALGPVNAPSNWWGCAAGPPNPPNVPCDTISAGVTALTPLAAAQTLPVTRYVTKGGNDNFGANSCLDSGLPCLTIQQALDKAYPGDRVTAAMGSYQESLSISKPVTLSGDRGDIGEAGPGPAAPVLDLSPFVAPLKNGADIAPAIPNVIIEGFVIGGFDDQVPDPGNTGIGIRAYNGTATPSVGILIRDNRIAKARWAGVSAANIGESLFQLWDVSFNDIQLDPYALGKNVYGIELANPLNSMVSRNRVSAGFSGIRISAEAAPGFSGLAAGFTDVASNELSKAESTDIELASYDPVAPFNLGTPVLQEARVLQNSLSNYGTSLSQHQAIYAAAQNPGQIRFLTIASNQIGVSDEKYVGGASVELINIQGLALNRNTITSSGPTSGAMARLDTVSGHNEIQSNVLSLFGKVLPPPTPFRHGLDIGGSAAGAIFHIDNNRISGAVVMDPGVTDLSAGIRLRGSLGTGTVLNLGCNEIFGFNDGILADNLPFTAAPEFHNNSFTSNRSHGIAAGAGGTTINATNNWWGHASGPLIGNSAGVRDGVAGNVIHAPPLGAPPSACKAWVMTPATELAIARYSEEFVWTPGINAKEYSLKVGSTPGGGEYFDEATKTVVDASNATPIVITTATPHHFVKGELVHIEGVTGNTAANGNFAVDIVGPTTFKLTGAIGNGAYAGGGTAGRAGRKVRVSGFPTDGSKVYMQLGAKINGLFQYSTATYQQLDIGDHKAEMQLPVPSSTLADTTVTFVWGAGDNVTEYQLKVGTTGVDSGNIFNGSVGLDNSKEITGLPSDGSVVYVRLISIIGGLPQSSDYTYTAWTYAPKKAEMISPDPVTAPVLASSTVTFIWSKGIGVTEYYLMVGTSAVGSSNIFSQSTGTTQSATVDTLPTTGGPVYVRLRSKISGVFQDIDYVYTAYTAPDEAAQIISPVPGSNLLPLPVTFAWTTGKGVSEYQLLVGTSGAGSTEVANLTGLAVTSALVSTLPVSGGTLYVRLRSKIGVPYQNKDYTYAVAGKAAISAPVPGSTLASTSVVFSWTAGSQVNSYTLDVGTAPGLKDLFSKNTGLATSANVLNLPANGSTVYVRLNSHFGSTTLFSDYTYTAASIAGEPAVITTPVPGSTLTSSAVFFTWTKGVKVIQYRLAVGTSAGGGDIFNDSTGTVTGAAVAKIPTDGSTIYVRLYSLIGGTWYFADYTYTAGSVPDAKAILTAPVPGSTLSFSTASFLWTKGGNVQLYRLALGSSPGGFDLFNQSFSGTAATVMGLPINGSTIFVRLWSLIAGSWSYNNYTLTAASLAGAGGTLTIPAPSSTLASSSVSFAWTAGAGTSLYRLAVGSSAGAADLFNASTTGVQTAVHGLPTNGSTLHVTLWSLVAGSWQSNAYTYTAATLAGAPAVMLTPAAGSTLGAALPTTFSWSSGVGVVRYWLSVGTGSAGNTDLYSQGLGASRTANVAGLPSGGGPIYVRLWSLIGGTWLYQDTTYTAAP